MTRETSHMRPSVLHLAPGTARRPSELTRLGRAAVWYASHGWEVLPLYPLRGGWCTCPEAGRCTTPGMHAIAQGGKTFATARVAVVVAWWSQCPDAGVALRPGPGSGFVTLHIDPPPGGGAVAGEPLALPRTVQAHNGIGQRIVFFAYPTASGVRPGTTPLGHGLLLKADGACLIAPPTRCGGGRLHRWEPECEPWRTPLAAAPPWLVSAALARQLPSPASN